MRVLVLLFLLCFAGLAQEAHWVELGWSDLINPVGTTYSVYRAPGLCSGTPVFAKIANGINAKTGTITTFKYDDKPLSPGNYCYAVTASFNSMESAQSNTAQAAVPAKPPVSTNTQIK